MTVAPDILQLASMLDDPDHKVAVNLLSRLLAREDELGPLPSLLQESADPLIRRRAHMLQNALTMRRYRREIGRVLNGDAGDYDLFDILIGIHMLWFDKDQYQTLRNDVDHFLKKAQLFALTSLDDAELFLRKHTFLPVAETTIDPESYCIGTVLFHHSGATGLLMLVICELLDSPEFRLVKVMGEFGVMDSKGNILLGNGSWRLAKTDPAGVEYWSKSKMLKYITVTLLSCAVNSDSYRYVMSIAQTLTGDDSEDVMAGFPYPFAAGN